MGRGLWSRELIAATELTFGGAADRQAEADRGADAGLALDGLEHLCQLLFGADQRVDVLHSAGIAILCGRCPARGQKRLAGGVRDEVEMEEALGSVHSRRACLVEGCG